MDAQAVLVIILAAALAVFLILAIVLTVMLIKVSRRVRDITDKADLVAEDVVSVSHLVRKSLQPAVISAAAVKAVKKVLGRDGKSKSKKGRK